MILNDTIYLENYKCYNERTLLLEKIMPINVIIGKNNSGKSSILDVINFLTRDNTEFSRHASNGKFPVIHVSYSLTNSDLSKTFSDNKFGGAIDGNHLDYAQRHFGDTKYTYHYEGSGKWTFTGCEKEILPAIEEDIKELIYKIPKPLEGLQFCHISAERDFSAEKAKPDLVLKPNGDGATNYIQQVLNKSDLDSDLIELTLLTELNSIVNPDIEFKRILVQKDGNDLWEIFFDDLQGNRIALSKMGSGIKTILIVLLNLLVRPKIESRKASHYVFAFEELENNLHPALQRRLYSFIREFSSTNNCYFFLTTHSNIVIDAFGSSDKAQIIHVSLEHNRNRINTIATNSHLKNILFDLDIKASDLLQSNGIIWVEGPSDRNYINKWIEIAAPNLKEGLHYSIMFYGGRLLSNVSFDCQNFDSSVIPLLKINTNAYVVIDRDGSKVSPKLNDTKLRILKELGENTCWITEGREIENYLDNETIQRWLKKYYELEVVVENNKNDKIEICISALASNVKYQANKTIFSSQIKDFITQETMTKLNLQIKIKELILKIESWNF